MRASQDIVKEIKAKGFKDLSDPAFCDLSKELHNTLTWERNTKLVTPKEPEAPEAPEAKEPKASKSKGA